MRHKTIKRGRKRPVSKTKAVLVWGITTIILSLLFHGMIVTAAATGQCYTNMSTYQFDEVVVITISTSTGIDNARLLIYLPNGQINTYTVGKLGVGVWQFSLGSAGPPEGQRIIVLQDGSTTLYTMYYYVVSSSPTIATNTLTMIRYRTSTVRITSTQYSTVTKLRTLSQTTIQYQTLAAYATASMTELHTVTAYTTTYATQYQTSTMTLTIVLPSFLGSLSLSGSTAFVYALLGVIVLLILAVFFAIAKMAKK
jgi:hypothetical protein